MTRHRNRNAPDNEPATSSRRSLVTGIAAMAMTAAASGATPTASDSDLARRVRRLEDIEEIRRLRNLYHYFVNEKLSARFAELYVSGGVMSMDKSIRWEGVPAIVAGFTELSGRVTLLKQFSHNHQVEIGVDTASAFSYFEASYAIEGKSLRVAGKYDEDYVRTAAGWRIRHTAVSLIYSVPPDVGWAGENLNYFNKGRP